MTRAANETQFSIHSAHISLESNLESIQAQNSRNQVSTYHQFRQIQDSIASLNATVSSLAIVEDQGDDRYSMLAGQNVQEVLQPLMAMHSSLVPIMSELLREGQIRVTENQANELYNQFDELIATCHDVSARELRNRLR